jgi:hypothetical protein
MLPRRYLVTAVRNVRFAIRAVRRGQKALGETVLGLGLLGARELADLGYVWGSKLVSIYTVALHDYTSGSLATGFDVHQRWVVLP